MDGRKRSKADEALAGLNQEEGMQLMAKKRYLTHHYAMIMTPIQFK